MAEILSIRRKTLSQKINQSLSKSINKIEFSFVSVSSCASWYSACTGSHRYRLRNRSRTAECLVVIRLNSLTLGNVRKCPPVSCLCGFFFFRSVAIMIQRYLSTKPSSLTSFSVFPV